MTLVFMTTAKFDSIKKTIGASLSAMNPPPDNRFIVPDGAAPQVQDDDIVVACGEKAVDLLRALGIVHKSRTVNSLREKLIVKPGIPGRFMVTFDPGSVNNDFEKKALIDWDVRLAARVHDTGTLAPPVGQYRWVDSFDDIIEQVEAKFAATGRPVALTTDLETMGFFPWYEGLDILSISFTVEPGFSDLLYVGPQDLPLPISPERLAILTEQVRWLLNTPKVKLQGQNLKFDLIWLAVKWEIECTNFTFDNMLVGSLLDENRSNSLNHHAKVLTPMGGYDGAFNAKYDKGLMHLIPPGEDFLTYAGGDTDAAHQGAEVLRSQILQDAQLTNFYVTILHPAARAFEKIERRGVLVDQEKFAILRDDLSKEIHEHEQAALNLLPHKMRAKFMDKISDNLDAGKDPITNAMKMDFYFTPMGLNLKPIDKTETGKISTAKSHLDKFMHVPEAKAMHEALTGLARARKTRSTFVDGFLKHLRPDGRVHPTYFLGHADFEESGDDESGTVTGRLSAKNPPFQIIPKKTPWAKRIRECYPAPPGKVMISIDYSQGELRVVACVANEKTMIAAYEAGLDLHAVTGAKLGSVDLDTFLSWKDEEGTENAALFEKYRGNAKPANFGLLYGMQAPGFLNYAWAVYGKVFTLEEATFARDTFFELYPRLPAYHENMRQFSKIHELVRSPLGRIRHLPTIKAWDSYTRSRAELQAINSPIQSTLTDMMIWAIALIEAELGERIEIVGMIHDAFIAYVDADKVADVFSDCFQIMSNLPFDQLGWSPVLKFPVDGEAGPNMASLKKIKL